MTDALTTLARTAVSALVLTLDTQDLVAEMLVRGKR